MTPEDTFEIAVGTNGMVETIYKDELADIYRKLGKVVDIKRASHIEWEDNPDGKGWTVRAAHNPRLVLRKGRTPNDLYAVSADDTLAIVYFDLRATALVAERTHFWDLLPGEKTLQKKEIK